MQSTLSIFPIADIPIVQPGDDLALLIGNALSVTVWAGFLCWGVKDWARRSGRTIEESLFANASGRPAISLPLHWNEDNLLIGVQLLGRYGDEATLIGPAAQLEDARPW